MRVADINGDSLTDIVTGTLDGVRVFPSRGDLRFGEPRVLDVDGSPWILPGDLDGDGDPDLALEASDPALGPALLVLWNSAGGFPSRTVLESGFDARWAALTDLNADGLLDIVSQGIDEESMGAFGAMVGRGNGSFEAQAGFHMGERVSFDSGSAADMDGDGDQDVLATLSSHIAIFFNSGAAIGARGTLHLKGPGPIAAVDLDADGGFDLAIAGGEGTGLGLFWNSGDSAFTGPERVSSSELIALDPGDLDGDGDTDVAAAVHSGVQLFVNETARRVRVGDRLRLGSTPVSVLARDADGDGDLDLVTANSLDDGELFDNLSIFSNQGLGAFLPARNFFTGTGPSSLTAADFDRDGDVDLAVQVDRPPGIVFHENGDRGFYTRRAVVATHDQARFIIAIDADLDADSDLAVGPGFRFLLNRGGWSFDWGGDPVDALMEDAMAAGDLDGDGAPEIIAAASSWQLAILPNLGGGRLGGPMEPRNGGSGSGSGSSVKGMAVADLDGNGRNDVVWSESGSRGFIRIRMNRTNLESSLDADDDGVPDECESQAFRRGDSNADGRVDVSDPIHILRSLFLGESALVCADATDANDDSRLDVSDPISLLRVLFLGDPEPPPPWDGCGPDPTADGLGCASYGACG